MVWPIKNEYLRPDSGKRQTRISAHPARVGVHRIKELLEARGRSRATDRKEKLMATIPITSKNTRKEKLLSELIRERRATPNFDGRRIPEADLREILNAGTHAPSGYNIQPWRFIVVHSPE